MDNSDMPTLINFLNNDGYHLEDIDYNPRYGATARAIFSKDVHIAEINGNDINDANIIVTVEFDNRLDYKNGVMDEEEGMQYVYDETKARTFIEALIGETYGGRKSKRNKRKTRKNKRR